MNSTKKMTKKDYFNQFKEKYPLTKDEVEFVDKELALLEKKNTKNKSKPTEQQKANEILKNAIYNTLESNIQYTIISIIKTVPECANLSYQKVYALVYRMVESGLLVRTKDKDKSYFHKP